MHQNLSSIKQECHHGLLISTMRGGCRDDLQSLKSNYTDRDIIIGYKVRLAPGFLKFLEASGTGGTYDLIFFKGTKTIQKLIFNLFYLSF